MLKTLNQILFVATPFMVALLAWKGGGSIVTALIGFLVGLVVPILVLYCLILVSGISVDDVTPYAGILVFTIMSAIMYGWYRWPDK